jgi:AcrR family transcriptional regulator
MRLTRSQIIGTAIELIERDGVGALSMRVLATELGCGIVPLYERVPSKAALLDRVAAAVMSEIELAVRRAQQPAWNDRVRAQARAFRDQGLAYPRCTVLAIGRPAASGAPKACGEQALGALCDAGFDGRDSARIVRAILAYVLGSAFRDACEASGPSRPPGERNDEDFEFGLDHFLRAAEELLAAQGGQQARAS